MLRSTAIDQEAATAIDGTMNDAGPGDLAKQIGDDVSGLVEREVRTAKSEPTETGKEGAAGAGLLGGAAVSGYLALLFGSIAVWRGLGNRIGFGKWSDAVIRRGPFRWLSRAARPVSKPPISQHP